MSGRNAEFAAQALPGMEEHPMRVGELNRVRSKPMAQRSPEEMLHLAKYQSPLMFGESAERKGYVVSHAMGAKRDNTIYPPTVAHNTPHLPEEGHGYEDVHSGWDTVSGEDEVTNLGIHVGSLGAAVDRNGSGPEGRRSAFLHLGEVQGDYERSHDAGEDWGEIPEKAVHYVNDYEDPGSVSILAPRRLDDKQRAQGAAGVRFYQDEVHAALKYGQPVNPKAAEMARTGAPLHHEIVPDEQGDLYSDQYDRRARVRPSSVEPEPKKPGVDAVRSHSQQLVAFAVDHDKAKGTTHFYDPTNISKSFDQPKSGAFASPQFEEMQSPPGKKVPVPSAF